MVLVLLIYSLKYNSRQGDNCKYIIKGTRDSFRIKILHFTPTSQRQMKETQTPTASPSKASAATYEEINYRSPTLSSLSKLGQRGVKNLTSKDDQWRTERHVRILQLIALVVLINIAVSGARQRATDVRD